MRKTKIICTLGPATDRGRCVRTINQRRNERCKI